MAGHSKWANIKHRKARVDAKRGKIFSRLGREIMMAAREAGGNPDINIRLKLAIDRARSQNLPQDNIQRAIQRGTGEVEGAQYEEIMYEGYGPGGVAIMIEIMTDNRNRTVADIRHVFTKHGGSLGESGCVSWMFQRTGQINLNSDHDEDELMLVAIDAGATDLRREGEGFVIETPVEDLQDTTGALTEAGIAGLEPEITYVPTNQVPVTGDDAARLVRMLDALEDQDDVQNVYANFDISDEELERLSGE